jgi:hypothetical protein
MRVKKHNDNLNKGFKNSLTAVPVRLGIEGRLSEKDGVLLRGHSELVVEGVMPDLLHVVPVGDDAVLDGILEGEDATLGLRLVAHVGVLLAHAHHHALGKRQALLNQEVTVHAASYLRYVQRLVSNFI